MKANKGKDSKGIVAEVFKHGGSLLRSKVLETINEAVAPNVVLPSGWKRTCVSVIHKSGDKKLAKNYRPICVLPLLRHCRDRAQCAQSGGHTR